MARVVAILLGFGLVLVGIAGFFVPAIAETRQSSVHNWVHIASGVLALLSGLFTTRRVASRFDVGFGAFWLLLGSVGFVLGRPSSGPVASYDPRTFDLVPGHLQLVTLDHMLHLVIGVLFVAGGILGREGRPLDLSHPGTLGRRP